MTEVTCLIPTGHQLMPVPVLSYSAPIPNPKSTDRGDQLFSWLPFLHKSDTGTKFQLCVSGLGERGWASADSASVRGDGTWPRRQ